MTDDRTLTPVHIGRKIEERLNQLGISKSEFARRLGTQKQNITRILKKEGCETNTLIRYCQILDYNYFELFMAQNRVDPGRKDYEDNPVLRERINGLERLVETQKRIIELFSFIIKELSSSHPNSCP